MSSKNIYSNIPDVLKDEFFEVLQKNASIKIERIVSRGHNTPENNWYDQPQNEWVILLKGSAGLRLENEDEPRVLEPGDFIMLPAHLKHRVDWTAPDTDTVWLAIHFS